MERKKKIIYFSIYFMVIFLAGYYVVKADYQMPKAMPADFAFRVNFGFDGKSEINTFTNTFTKDILKDGKVSGKFTFTEDEMKELNVVERKKLSPLIKKWGEKPVKQEIWEIRLDGHYIYLHVKEFASRKPTDDAQKLFKLRQRIFEMVKQKKEYQRLPEAREGFTFYEKHEPNDVALS
jgi:hypothetical protein